MSGMLFVIALLCSYFQIAITRVRGSLPFSALAHMAGHQWVAGHARAAPVPVVARERTARLAGRY